MQTMVFEVRRVCFQAIDDKIFGGHIHHIPIEKSCDFGVDAGATGGNTSAVPRKTNIILPVEENLKTS